MEIGALWKQTAKSSGKEFFSGSIDIPGLNIKIAIFPNENKTATNHPDFKIIWSKPKENGQQGEGFPNTGGMPNTGQTPPQNQGVPSGFDQPNQQGQPGNTMSPGMPGYNGQQGQQYQQNNTGGHPIY